MGNFLIRKAAVEDSPHILRIYSYYVEHTAISFETATPAPAEFSGRVESILSAYPYLVYEAEGEILGYAYASRHQERAAYRYDVDVSVYVKNGAQARGIGTALYEALFSELTKLNYYNAYAAVALPNEKSVALHHKFGFKDIGVFHSTGYKFGKWHDVLWLEKPLKDYALPPK